MASLVHLATRFVESLRPGPPSDTDLHWIQERLPEPQWRLLHRMSNPDQRHAIEVARAVVAELPEASAEVVAAAALHDVGKIISGFRTPARVVATVAWTVLPDRWADDWLDTTGMRRRLAAYRRHPELGAELLADAGASQLTADWAADHHKPRDRWRIDPSIGDVLKACDGD